MHAIERRAEVLGESLVGSVERLLNVGSDKGKDDERSDKELQRLVQRFGNREHLLGVVIYDRNSALVAITPELAKTLTVSPTVVTPAIKQGREESSFARLGGLPVHILALPLHRQDEVSGSLVVAHDVSYIRSSEPPPSGARHSFACWLRFSS
jgi:hypothetical protein